MSKIPPLQPGDHLIYGIRGRGMGRWICWAIALKTACLDAVHIEIYDGDGMTMASRAGIGVDEYPLDLDGLTYVLRPRGPWDLNAARAWFRNEAKGQGYDWWAVARFMLPMLSDVDRTRQICSALSTRLDRMAGFEPFSTRIDADTVAPRDFLYSSEFDAVYAASLE